MDLYDPDHYKPDFGWDLPPGCTMQDIEDAIQDREEPKVRIRMYSIQSTFNRDAGLSANELTREVNEILADKDADDVKRVEVHPILDASGERFVAFLWIAEEEDEYVGKQYSHPHRYGNP